MVVLAVGNLFFSRFIFGFVLSLSFLSTSFGETPSSHSPEFATVWARTPLVVPVEAYEGDPRLENAERKWLLETVEGALAALREIDRSMRNRGHGSLLGAPQGSMAPFHKIHVVLGRATIPSRPFVDVYHGLAIHVKLVQNENLVSLLSSEAKPGLDLLIEFNDEHLRTTTVGKFDVFTEMADVFYAVLPQVMEQVQAASVGTWPPPYRLDLLQKIALHWEATALMSTITTLNDQELVRLLRNEYFALSGARKILEREDLRSDLSLNSSVMPAVSDSRTNITLVIPPIYKRLQKHPARFLTYPLLMSWIMRLLQSYACVASVPEPSFFSGMTQMPEEAAKRVVLVSTPLLKNPPFSYLEHFVLPYGQIQPPIVSNILLMKNRKEKSQGESSYIMHSINMAVDQILMDSGEQDAPLVLAALLASEAFGFWRPFITAPDNAETIAKRAMEADTTQMAASLDRGIEFLKFVGAPDRLSDLLQVYRARTVFRCAAGLAGKRANIQ